MELCLNPDNPPPEGARGLEILTRDSVRLRAMVAVPDRPCRGTVVVMGGRGDFMERYFETMRDFQARGFAVTGFDWRGQGGSQRLHADRYRGHITDFKDFEEDLRAVMTGAVHANCPAPFYAVAHSTGGNIVLNNLRRHRWFSRVIALAPLIGLRYGAWPKPVVAVLVFLATATGQGWVFLPGQMKRPMGAADFPGNPLTLDRQRWQRDSRILESAPHLGLGGPTFSWLRAARRATAALQSMGRGDELLSPAMVVEAGLDPVVDGEAIRRFARNVPNVAYVKIEEALHEILSERTAIRRQFLALFDSYIGEDADYRAEPAHEPA